MVSSGGEELTIDEVKAAVIAVLGKVSIRGDPWGDGTYWWWRLVVDDDSYGLNTSWRGSQEEVWRCALQRIAARIGGLGP